MKTIKEKMIEWFRGEPARVFSSRAEFAAAVSTGREWPIGATVMADGQIYRFTGSENGVPSLDGWEPDGLITPYQFGAVGNYDADDTEAIRSWLSYYEKTRRPLWVAKGVFRCTDYIALPEGIIMDGVGGPRITTFPMTSPEKNKLREGYKGTLSGASLIFSGEPSSSPYVTERSDKYEEITPCLLYAHYGRCDVRGFDVIQDMDVFTSAGVMTTKANDNAARGYTAGILQLGYGSRFDVGIFGYFSVGGFISYAKLEPINPNPDYVQLIDCDIASGVHILGAQDNTGVTVGNTGLTSMGSRLFGSDHHHRPDCDPTIPTIYMDGATSGSNSGIRAFTALGGGLRTYANDAIVLGRCDDFRLTGVTIEFSRVEGVDGLDEDGVIKGSAATGNVILVGLAGHTDLGLAALAATIRGKYTFVESGEFDTLVVGEGGAASGGASAVRIMGGTGDSIIQLTSDISSTNSQWTIRRDVSESNRLDIRWAGGTLATLGTDGSARFNGDVIAKSIAARTKLREQTTFVPVVEGAITVPDGFSFIKVDTEGSADTDDLTQVNGMAAGDLVFLKANNADRTIVIKHANSGGNIRTNGRTDITLDNSLDVAMLFHNGSHVVASLYADAGT